MKSRQGFDASSSVLESLPRDARFAFIGACGIPPYVSDHVEVTARRFALFGAGLGALVWRRSRQAAAPPWGA